MIFPNLSFLFKVFRTYFIARPPDWKSGLQCCVAGVPTAADISVIASLPGVVAALNIPVASAAAVDSAVTDVISAVGIASAPAVVLLSAVSGPPLMLLF